MSLNAILDPQRLKSLHDELGTMIAEEERKEQGMPHSPDRILVKHADMAEEMQKNTLDIVSQVNEKGALLRSMTCQCCWWTG